jgi:hypothetical protein
MSLAAVSKPRHARWKSPESAWRRRPPERSPMSNRTTPERSAAVEPAIGDAVARTLAVVGLAAVALIHLLDAHDTFVSAPYKGWLYVCLIVCSLATAAVLVRRSDQRAWTAALLLPLGAIAAFVVSRTVGLPSGADDIGNWWEPLGVASLFVEGLLVVIAAAVLGEQAKTSAPRPGSLRFAEASLERSAR